MVMIHFHLKFISRKAGIAAGFHPNFVCCSSSCYFCLLSIKYYVSSVIVEVDRELHCLCIGVLELRDCGVVYVSLLSSDKLPLSIIPGKLCMKTHIVFALSC